MPSNKLMGCAVTFLVFGIFFAAGLFALAGGFYFVYQGLKDLGGGFWQIFEAVAGAVVIIAAPIALIRIWFQYRRTKGKEVDSPK